MKVFIFEKSTKQIIALHYDIYAIRKCPLTNEFCLYDINDKLKDKYRIDRCYFSSVWE